jgi:ATP-binding protein involved in chromosome partitioning
MTSPTVEQVQSALSGVNDPEIRRPITEIGMVGGVEIAPTGAVAVNILLTISGCPMRQTLTDDVTAAVRTVPGVTDVRVDFGVMNDEQRAALQPPSGAVRRRGRSRSPRRAR